MLDAQPTGPQAADASSLAAMRYGVESGEAFLSGIQALARLPLDQRRLDIRAGLNTGGFISGYRGSPLGGLDRELWRQSEYLDALGVVFQPGVNEELAATAVWGSQQVGLFPGATRDGVFGLWYGKAPGLDRSSDALRHANAAGASPHGGVLLAVGDDPGCKSSTLPSASEFALRDLDIPVLAPSDVADVLDFGLFGLALSRYAGCWASLVAVTDVMDSAMTVRLEPDKHQFVRPPHTAEPHIRLADSPFEKEARVKMRLRLAAAFAAANGIDRVLANPARPRLVVVTAGKAYADVREALAKLGLPTARALADAGVRLVKLGMTWPLNPAFAKEICRGAKRLLVVEPKRPFVEEQLRSLLFGTKGLEIRGKGQTNGGALPAIGELDVPTVATALADALGGNADTGYLREVRASRVATHGAPEDSRVARLPVYCPGCPHNLSTRVPQGSRAGAGIGCHYMAQWMDRDTHLPTQMGGEGANWIGQAPFTDEPHLFVNLGDGTYFHSGLLAIRASVAAGVSVTYKILANDAVAMTGGQPVDGALTVANIAAQVLAEGVSAVRVVADDSGRHRRRPRSLPRRIPVFARKALDAVQRELRETPGCTVLIYDQTCAAELRRRRKRDLAPDPDVRVFINDAVCEGCGDCSRQSSCAAIEPLETELGVKRAINQSACNKDLACVAGFCPAIVTLRGAKLPRVASADLASLKRRLPLPTGQPATANILIAGVGGTGVVTVSQLVGTAAHLDGKFASTMDATGLAQKGGAVVSHVRVSNLEAGHAVTRVPAASADLLIAADQVTAASRDVLALLSPSRTTTVINKHIVPTADFVLATSPESIPAADANGTASRSERIAARTRTLRPVDAEAATKALFGTSTCANVFLLGFAFQLGALPVTLAALEKVIHLNGVAVADNLSAFHHGRAAALPETAPASTSRPQAMLPRVSRTLEERIAYRRAYLVDYQDEALARRYENLVARVRAAEAGARPHSTALTEAAAESYFQLLAVKDEYEVARLFVAGAGGNDASGHGFRAQVAAHFAGRPKLTYHFAPTWTFLSDAQGRPRKIAAPHAIAFPALRLLAKLKRLRGTVLDPFRLTADRKLERRLRACFETDLDALLPRLNAANFDTALALMRLPATVKGFGPVKEAAAGIASKRRGRLFTQLFPKPAKGEATDSAAETAASRRERMVA